MPLVVVRKTDICHARVENAVHSRQRDAVGNARRILDSNFVDGGVITESNRKTRPVARDARIDVKNQPMHLESENRFDPDAI